MQTLYQILVMLVLALGAYTDLKERTVYEFPHLVMFLLGLLLRISPRFSLVCLIIATLLPADYFAGFGKGDFMSIALIFISTGFATIRILFISLFFGLLYYLIKRESSIPLVTMLFLGYTLWFFL